MSLNSQELSPTHDHELSSCELSHSRMNNPDEVDPRALLDDEQTRESFESAVRDAVRHESGWEVWRDAVLGQCRFQKLAMPDDDGRHATEIAEHVYCRRIAGDDSTPPPFAVAIPSPARFDAEVHPSKLHTILPCDSSQLEAILAIKSGASLVLDGPSGWPSSGRTGR